MGIYEKLAKNKNLKEYITDISEKSLKLKEDFISTGIATLNILYSGRIDGGIPKHKISMIAGETQSGKSLQSVYLIKQALKKGMQVFYIDTEFAMNEVMINNFKLEDAIKDKQLIIIPENDITQVKQIVANLKDELDFDEKENSLLIIDSWGGLVNSKQLDDAMSGKDVADLQTTRAKNGLANLLLTLHPMTIYIVNHVYQGIGSFVPTKEISGGSKIQYVASAIVKTTSQAKDKDGNDVIGKVVTAITEKGRYVKPHTKLKYLIRFDGGIHPYYGLLDDALEGGYVIKPNSGWYTRPFLENDKKWREKEIWENSKEFWRPILKETDFPEYIRKKYELGSKDSSEIEMLDI